MKEEQEKGKETGSKIKWGEREEEGYVWDEETGEERVWTNISCKNKQFWKGERNETGNKIGWTRVSEGDIK